MTKISDIYALRVAGDIMRNHTLPVLDRTDTVGKHSYNAANLLTQLFPDASKELIVYVLRHDWAEAHTGDIPGPAKTTFPEIGDAVKVVEDRLEDLHKRLPVLTDIETKIFKFIDFAEWYLWCHEEYARGNRTVRFVETYHKTRRNMEDYVKDGTFNLQIKIVARLAEHIISETW